MSAVIGEEGLSCTDKGGSSDAGVCTFWRKKLWIFQNLWWVHTDKGVWASVDILQTSGGQFFHDFVQMSFMDVPLL